MTARISHLPPRIARALVGGLGACLLVGWCTAAQGQVMAMPVGVSTGTEPNRSFTMPVSAGEVTEALEDFRRYVKKSAWERAFKALDKVLESTAAGLSPRGDGVLLPTTSLVREELAALPADGKQAYRLFHDAEAKVLLEQARGSDELERLKKIYGTYLLTSSGDVAADTLGDLYFEQGDLDRAAECWQAALRFHPDSSLSRVQLLVKSAIAAARAGRWERFAELQEQVRSRHAGEKVMLGGRQVDAAEHLEALAAGANSAKSQATETSVMAQPDLRLPEAEEIAWQFRFLGPKEIQALGTLGNNWGWRMRFPIAEMVPPAATDGSRVYMNLLGYLFAVDLETGKLVWRSGKVSQFTEKLNQGQQWSPEQYSLVYADGQLWSVARKPNELAQHGPLFHLGRHDPASGKEVWNTRSISSSKVWNILGTPVIVGDRVFVAGAKQEQPSELHALAFEAATGKLAWSTHLGTGQGDQNNFFRRISQPALAWHNGKLFIDTHSGGLFELDARSGAIDWAFAYESEPVTNNYYYNQQFPPLTAGTPQVIDNRVFFKGMRSSRLYQLDLAGPKIEWDRPVDQTAMIVGMDRDQLYLSGFSSRGDRKGEVMAIDLATKRLKWSTQLAESTSWIRPVVTAGRLYQFTSRGMYEIDKATGDTPPRPFRVPDLDSLGGALIVTPGKLLAISNLAITAYELKP